MIDYDKNTNLDIENSIIKCVGLNEIGSKIIREFKKNKKEIATQFVSSINPSISLIEKYQMKLELIYSYLCNKYNSNSDLFKYPVKIEQK